MKLYAHRGYKYKENTLKSFENSFNLFDGFEFDVRLTKDNIPIVIHDYNLVRTHNSETIIHLSNYDYLRKYKLPLLIDVLKLVEKNKKYCIIDIKVKENSKLILRFLYNLVNNKIIDYDRFYCIVYTDNIHFFPNIKVLRVYNVEIPDNINMKFNGIALKYNGLKNNINSIKKFLNKNKKLNNHFHLNLYILESHKEKNLNFNDFLFYLKDNYNNISFTFDKLIDL